MDPAYLWQFLLPGYLFTIAIEIPIVYFGVSPRHSPGTRLFAGFWLTACTYPIVVLVLPLVLDPVNDRVTYLLVAEAFAHFGECALFWLAFGKRASFWRDMAAVFAANFASFALGEGMQLVLNQKPEWHPLNWFS